MPIDHLTCFLEIAVAHIKGGTIYVPTRFNIVS